jgi:hypothetical protein
MNRPLLLLLLLSGSLLWAEPPAAPVPKPPYVAQAPANCSWTVRIASKTEPDTGPVRAEGVTQTSLMPAGATAVRPVLKEIKINKAGQTRQIIQKWSDGKSKECWWLKNICLAEMQTEDGHTEVVALNGEMQGAYQVNTAALLTASVSGADYSKGDFPELSWIQAGMFVGVGSPKENPYFVFRSNGISAEHKAPTQGLSNAGMVNEARIDVSTKLPISFSDGTNVRNYTFSDGAAALQLPERFGKAVQKYKEALEASKYRQMPNR